MYISYNEDQAKIKSREIRDLAGVAGVELREDSRAVATWQTRHGGGLYARAIVGGALTGTSGLRLVMIDDPVKGRREAEQAAVRRDIWGSFSGNVVSRLHSNTSIIIWHTRWVEDDPIGRILDKQKHNPDDPDWSRWEYVNITAINDAGESFCPELMPLDLLRFKRSVGGDYDWFSLYMGQPRSREGKVFQGVRYFDVVPSHRRVAIGVDLSYSGKTSSDWSVAVVMAESAGRYYVLDVVRRQVPATVFAADLAQLQRSYPGAPTVMYASGRDWEQIEVMRKLGAPIVGMPASTDKYVRAQGLSAKWNDLTSPAGVIEREGLVYLQSGARWLGQYTSVLMDFTGHGDDHDDDVDATVAAFDALPSSAATGPAVHVPQAAVEARPRRDPALTTRGRGKIGTW